MPTHPFAAQRALFKAYDIRGNNTLFTTAFVEALSDTFAQDLAETTLATKVVIGYDVRHGSKGIAEQFAENCLVWGIEVIWIGLVSTPVMAFWANQFEGHGLIATASHSEKHITGIKWLIAGESPSEDAIQHLYQRLQQRHDGHNQTDSAHPTTTSRTPAIQTVLAPNQVAETYAQSAAKAIAAINDFQQQTKPVTRANPPDCTSLYSSAPSFPAKPLKIVIDCLNGATGPYANAFFSQNPQLCGEFVVLNKFPDGDFPKGNPDPMEDNRLTELSAAVVSHQADIGLAFDGDGDRLMVIDNLGHPLAPDHLLYLLARVAVEDNCSEQETHTVSLSTAEQNLDNTQKSDIESTASTEKPTVIFDVKCTHHLPRLIEELGAVPQMSKTGSSILRRALQTRNNGDKQHILFAGELSGHFLFNDGYFLLHDDAMYAALRLLNWLQAQAQRGKPSKLAEIISTLPPMVSTPDIYLPLDAFDTPAAKNEAPLLTKLLALCDKLNRNVDLPKGSRLTCIDGLRLDFDYGFGIIRPSNTSNSLTVRFVGDSISDLKGVQSYFVKLCQFINDDLANQIASINVKH